MGFFDEFDRAMDSIAEKAADVVEKETYNKHCLPLVKLESCITWAKKMREKFPQSAGFIIAVKNNPAPKNENDLIIVTMAMLDINNQPVIYEGQKSVSTLIYGKTIDERLLNQLNGNDSIMCKF